MYFVIFETFVKELNLAGAELLVFAAIYGAVTNMDGYISLKQISSSTSVSKAAVCKIISRFEEKGWLTKSSVGRRRKNKYAIHVVKAGYKNIPVVVGGKDKYLSSSKTANSLQARLPIVNKL